MRWIACLCFAVLLAGCGSNITPTAEAIDACRPWGITEDEIHDLFNAAQAGQDAGIVFCQAIIDAEVACDGVLNCNTCTMAVLDAVYNE